MRIEAGRGGGWSFEENAHGPRNFENFTTKLETPSCKLASTKHFQSANKLHKDLAKGLALTTKAKLCTRTSFSHGLEPTHSRRIHSNKLQAFPTAVRQAGSFLYGLTTHEQKAALAS